VEGFIDRLAGLLKGLFAESKGGRSPTGARADPGRHPDPDVQEAWEELDEFMRGGTKASEGPRRERYSSPPPRPPADESLRQDYTNLEVPFGADIETVRASYKRLMLKYHPDKHAGDPEKQRIALEITKKVNESFERIRARNEARRG
jgi:hypothetical protein